MNKQLRCVFWYHNGGGTPPGEVSAIYMPWFSWVSWVGYGGGK